MSPLLILALLLGTPQEEKYIKRVDKGIYLNAVKDLEKAAELIADDPGTAVEKVTAIFSNSKIKFFECKLKIEIASGEHDYHNFFPYQVRGKARMAQAKRATLQAREGIQAAAIADFKASVDKKVPGSAELLKEAEAALAKTKAEIEAERKPEDPLTTFKPKYDNYLSDDKFKSALAYVAKDGGALTEEQRKQLNDDAEEACRGFVEGKLLKLRSNLGDATVSGLTQMSDGAFKTQFANHVPPEGELTDKMNADPTLTWARRHILKTLKSIQAKQGKPDEVFTAASDALKVDPPDFDGENPWFRSMALLGSEICEQAINQRTRSAEALPKSGRGPLQAEADRIYAAWKEFEDRTDKKVFERHVDLAGAGTKLSDALKTFPVELTQLASFDIDRCFLNDPGPELQKVENGLLDLVAGLSSMGRVAIESRQELYTKLISAATLRRFIQGIAEDQVIRDLSEYRSGLRQAGGPIDPDRYGPRVKKVFDSLRM